MPKCDILKINVREVTRIPCKDKAGGLIVYSSIVPLIVLGMMPNQIREEYAKMTDLVNSKEFQSELKL